MDVVTPPTPLDPRPCSDNNAQWQAVPRTKGGWSTPEHEGYACLEVQCNAEGVRLEDLYGCAAWGFATGQR
jgi:hypothetical protein